MLLLLIFYIKMIKIVSGRTNSKNVTRGVTSSKSYMSCSHVQIDMKDNIEHQESRLVTKPYGKQCSIYTEEMQSLPDLKAGKFSLVLQELLLRLLLHLDLAVV